MQMIVSFMFQPLYSQEKCPHTHWTGGWLGATASLRAVENSKIYFPCQETNPDSSAVQPVAKST
jgi:hypothetical protein